jgi:hypothetical protein
MARKPNKVPSVTLRISTTPVVRDMLKRLVTTGLFGKTPSEAADRLIAEKLRDPAINSLLPKG